MIAYLIRCTGDVSNVPNLLDQIYDEKNCYIISVPPGLDKLVPKAELPSNCKIVTFGQITWGGNTMLSMVSSGMREALYLDQRWQHFIFLTETCIPLRRQDEMFAYLTQLRKQGYRDHMRLTAPCTSLTFPDVEYSGDYETTLGIRPDMVLYHDKVLRRYFSSVEESMIMQLALRATFHYVEAQAGFIYSRPLDAFERELREYYLSRFPLRFSNVWSILSRESVQWAAHSQVGMDCLAFCRTMFAPDEVFISSALTSRESGFDNRAINFMSSHFAGSAPGGYLDEGSFLRAVDSNHFFARKFRRGLSKSADAFMDRMKSSTSLFSEAFSLSPS